MEGSRTCFLFLLVSCSVLTSGKGFLWSYEDSTEVGASRASSDDYSYENLYDIQDYYDNNPIEYVRYNEGEIPDGAASLAFVFDITGSMYDDLVQVIEGAAKILATTLSRRDKPLYNYVLVPFHDPEIGPITVTTDPDKYQRDLRELYVQGGGDCPEMSVGAIKAALEECLPNSFIYVFTDARSKDYHLTEKVLTLIQQKQSQVVFVMTGDCGNTSHPGYKAYEQIASTSSGQVFLLKKSQVNQILDWVRVALQPRKVNLMSIDRAEVDESWLTLPVDSKLQEFTISISGYNPEVEIIDPTGYKLKKGRDYEELLNIAQALIVNVKSPRPGIWKLKATADKQHTIRITGLSVMNFNHGFSRAPTLDMTVTEARPVKGVVSHLLLNATGLDYPGKISSVELLDLGDNTLLQIPVRQSAEYPELYNLTAFMPPGDFFYIKVGGLDEVGNEFRRMSLTAINAIEPEAPAVYTPPVTKGYYDKPALLMCAVESIVPFSVQWMRGDEKLGAPLFYTESRNVSWSIPDASSSSEGVYRCNATNVAGWTLAQTYLDVKDPPPSILSPSNASVLPGNDAVLTCVAYSTVDFNMTWLGVNGRPLPSRAVVHNNGSLLIRRVELSDEGPYVCRAQNEGGHSDAKVHLLVQKAPLVNPVPAWQTFVTGSTVQMGCGAVAYPNPSYSWRRYGSELPTSGRKYSVARDGTLTVRDLQKADSGQYECVATNIAGTGSGLATLSYIEKPEIRVREKTVLVNNGDTATLQCIAEGIPAPNITWYRGTIQLSELSFIEIRELTGELVVLGVQDMDAGQYTCVATNDAGSSQETISLQVGSGPVIVAPPSSQGVDILENATLPCRAIGVPAPTITWMRQDGRPIVPGDRFTQMADGSLHIRGINKTDEGLYTCRVENQFGTQQMSAFISVTGIVSPLIAYSNPRIESIVGRRVQLSCVVLLGNPKPTITWLKMGEVVPASTPDGSQLIIEDVQLEHEGEYTCMATNVGGSATHITELDVQVPPNIHDDGRKDFSAIQGHSIRLPCKVTGDPKPLTSWTKNGVRITESDPHYFLSGDGSLEIFSADPQDTATYSCTAINIAGLKEKRMTLFVQIPPQISPGPDEYIVIVNNPIQIPCEAHGIPEPTTRWQRGGSDSLEGSGEGEDEGEGAVLLDNGYLRFPRVSVDDAGLYECVASSTAGNTTKVVMLTVQVPPRISGDAKQAELVALVGDNVTLPCEVIGTPWPQIKWKKDLRTIDFFNTNHKHHLEEVGSLYLPGVEVSDTGRFLCIAENPAGVVTKEISLIVHAIPSIPDDTPSEKDVIEGNRVVLPCPAEGTPAPLVTWYKAGKEVSANEIGVRLLPDGGLQLEHAEAQNAGMYECIATNVAGNDTHIVTLTVYMPPRFMGKDGELILEEPFDKRPENMEVMVNRTTRLLCDVAAHPPPQITWYKNDQEVKESGRVKVLNKGKVLEILGAEVKDSARYVCVARNLAGETEKSFDLDIQVPPSIDERLASPQNMTVLKDSAIIIECPINGVPNPIITWFKDGIQLQVEFDPNLRLLSDGKRLEIRSAYVTDTGEYRCHAKNDAGEIERKYTLNVWVPAQIDGSGVVSKPEVVVNKTITLHCPATGIPPPKVSWFRDGVAIHDNEASKQWEIEDDGYRIRLGSAQVDDAARYSCQAKNTAGQSEKYYDLHVLVPPYIERDGVDVFPEVVENRTVILSCPATGLPSPAVRWLRNGEVLPPQLPPSGRLEVLAGGRQLRITSSSLTDVGTYTCEASNKAGKDSQDFRLSVHIPAHIDRSGLDLSPKVIENRTHLLECPVEGIPSPSITWMKNGVEIDFQETPGFAIGASGQKLVIQSAKVEHTGDYECIAENDAGTDRLQYRLEVYVPPYIIGSMSTEPEPRVVVNETLTLTCEARGVPEPDIKWLLNGRPLLEGNNDERRRFLQGGKTLEISDIGVPDTGRYTCVATNNAGVADRDYDLQVWVPPYIDSNNLDLEPEVVQGKYVTLNCPAMGIPFPDVEWYKNGRPVDDQSNRIRFLLSRRQLEIQEASEEDKATYTCRATNVAGMAELAFQLSIWVPPSIDDANVVDKPKVIQNRTVLLECPVSGVPPPQVSWLRNGEPLELAVHMRLVGDGRSLEIRRAQEADTARYTCIASNQAGQLEQNFHLQILVPASIDGGTSMNRVEAVENSTIYLDCPVTGTPAPSVMWLKDGMPLLDFPYHNVRELSSGQKLEIRNVQVADEGRYICQATNVAGQERKAFRLKVLVPPRIPGSLLKEELAVVERRPVRMECYPTGDPTPTITWSKDGEELTTSSVRGLRLLRGGRILQIAAGSIDDAGLYVCTAKNVAGTDSKAYVLEVQVPPKIEDSLRIEGHSVIIGDSLSVYCNASGFPEPKLSWQRDGQPLSMLTNPNLRVTDEGHKLTIYNAQLLDIGGYTCRAENVAGHTQKEFLVNVLVPPSIEDAGESVVAATVNARTQLRCEALGLPEPDVVWYRDGQRIPDSGPNYRMHRSGTLEFSGVRQEDSGEYRCLATNPAGQADLNVTLTVQVPPKLVSTGPVTVTAIAGEEAFLPCEATGLPKPTIVWQKANRILTEDSLGYLISKGGISVSEAEPSDAGIYICMAQNNAGTALGQVRLEVQVPPTIEDQQQEFVVLQDREIMLPCRASGLPAPRITWKKDGHDISPSDYRFRVTRSGWLAIAIARTDDTAEFTCVAENPAGKATLDMELQVHVPPSIEETVRSLVVNEGEEARLLCDNTGFPKPTISWIQDGRIMIEHGGRYEIEDNGALVIRATHVRDTGSFVCTAKNKAGRDKKEVVLKVQVPPEIVTYPKDQEVMANNHIMLECEATGVPTPTISWKVNGTHYPSAPSVNGRSRLEIDNAVRGDDGTYMCVAENPAGLRRALAAVRVKVPPRVLLSPGGDSAAVTLAERVLLHCPVVEGENAHIHWTKAGRPVTIGDRIQQLDNGSLVIYDANSEDEGNYKCTATNEAGSDSGSAFLTVRSPPEFKVEPHDSKISSGDSLILNCVAEGEPRPTITWRKEAQKLYNGLLDRVAILPNDSLRIVAAQEEDAGLYICFAENPLGKILVQADVIVAVNGQWSSWAPWNRCTVTCGSGAQMRERTCDNPVPANGGRECRGHSMQTRTCMTNDCPVNGNWGDWSPWLPCSKSCGRGEKVRTRLCNNPSPQFGGDGCAGDGHEKMMCNAKPCPVDGDWEEWTAWRPCSETCGDGVKERYRRCNAPRPQYGGRTCSGSETDREPCNLRDCARQGNWGDWSGWSMCSLSCGGGKRSRSRACDNPPPSQDGLTCPGQDQQVDFCNREACPVHGNWGQWTDWGDCTMSCGGGQRKRFRMCDSPAPKANGRPCIGPGQDTQLCNSEPCSVDGTWTTWTQWSRCSLTCGSGEQRRERACQQPQHGGALCRGNPSQSRSCNTLPCGASLPQRALGNIMGTINGREFGPSVLNASISRTGKGTEVKATLLEVPGEIGRYLQHLISLLSPIYWTTATEVGEAVNGFTLTEGHFQRNVHVQFATGEVLKMMHIARGVDSQGVLHVDIALNGEVPVLPDTAQIIVLPYTEDYIQTGADSLYASSSRMFKVDGFSLPYAWNHTISYGEERGRQPFLVQRLTAQDLFVDFDVSKEVLQYQLTASIAKGVPSNQCPKGFLLDKDYCRDVNECAGAGGYNPCSHSCTNTPGSFSCFCPPGLSLATDGRICKDVDECELNIAQCHPNQDCLNSVGSYRCAVKCRRGFRRAANNLDCEDVNECRERGPRVCEQQCQNEVGTYRCSCRRGYTLVENGRCQDIDECRSGISQCSHYCHNTEGAYKCSCPSGFIMVGQGQCRDIDECREGRHSCDPGQECRNTEGSYECERSCPRGFDQLANGTCVDRDECANREHMCHFNQQCINTDGSYRCQCQRGYRSDGPGRPCVDVNECSVDRSICAYQCQNTRGSYRCLCPLGQQLLADGKSCAGLQFIEREQVLPCRGRGCTEQSVACPTGYKWRDGTCKDVDECAMRGRCQDNCINTAGSYRCTCPTGYRLAANRRTCQDIDECKEQNVNCGEDKMCFNRLGDFACVDTGCPPDYDRDPRTGYCVLECSKSPVPCQRGARYADILQFRMVSLRYGIPAYQDLIHLIAYNQFGEHLPQTTFTMLDNDDKRVPFGIRVENGKGVVSTVQPLEEKRQYRIKVRAKSYDNDRRDIQYQTTFILFISVSAFPY